MLLIFQFQLILKPVKDKNLMLKKCHGEFRFKILCLEIKSLSVKYKF